MKKQEFFDSIKSREENREYEFYKFMEEEGFIKSIDKVESFRRGATFFYRRITNNRFFIFYLPKSYNRKDEQFLPDFLMIAAESENDFVKKVIKETNVREVVAGFVLERDYDRYRNFKLEVIGQEPNR